MRRALVFCFVLTACIAGGRAPPRERDERLLREVARQQRWAQEAIDARPPAEMLERIRSNDYGAVSQGRKELKGLVAAADRATWSRDALVEAIRDGEDDPQLVREFERAARLRADALAGADELALALASARGALTLADLKPAFESLRRARKSEAGLEQQAGRAATGPKLSPSPLPSPPPFVTAAAQVLREKPDAAHDLEGVAGEDAVRVRAALAEREVPTPGPGAAPPAAAGEGAAGPPPPAGESPLRSPPPGPGAGGPPGGPAMAGGTAGSPRTLRLGSEARALWARRGPPRSVEARSDGTFALRWDEQRSCGAALCAQVDYVVDAAGKLVREEPVKP